MSRRVDYKAPWNMTVTLITVSIVVFFCYLAFLGFAGFGDHGWLWLLGMVVVPMTILLAALFYCVSGYSLVDQSLWIRRLGWFTKIDLSDIKYVKADEHAMSRAWRVFGNGGLFGFTGWYSNSRLGKFRAYATHPSLSVVLKISENIVVVTPNDPTQFVAEMADRFGQQILLPDS